MSHNSSCGRSFALLVAGLAGLASGASAQGLITSNGTVVAWVGDAVPDSTGTPIPHLTFGSTLDDCVIDGSGNVLFRAQVVDSGTPVTGINDRAILFGSSRSTLKLVVRGGDQAPGMAPGVLLRTALGTSTGLSNVVRLSYDGRIWFGSKIDDGGVNVTAANDDAAFGGPFGSLSLIYRDGDTAPGTGGATFAQAFSSPTLGFEGMNANGQVYTRATLANGTGVPPVTTTAGVNNQQGLWAGLPGALSLVARKSDTVQGLGGEVGIDNSNSLSFHMEMNDAGKVLFDITLSTTQGAPAATAANDRVLMVYTPGSGNQVLARESDVAPGTSGGTFNSVSVTDNWGASLAGNAWLRNDTVIFNTELRGGDVVAGINDKAIYRGGVGSLAMVARRGDVAPGTGGATWNGFNTANTLHNVNGLIAFQGFLVITGAVTAANDTGLWAGTPGNYQLVAREGDVAPGTGGSTFGALNGANVFINDANQVLFANTLAGGGAAGNALWVWDAAQGLRPVVLVTDQIEIVPTVFKTITSFTTNTTSNVDGAALTFAHNGTLGLRVNLNDGSRAIMTVSIPPNTASTSFCFGDGTGAACPCANSGTAGNGCANATYAGGARLASVGFASVTAANDTLTLTASDIPGPGLFFQGDGQFAGGLGITFGDGLLCAGGAILRLGVVFPTGNAATYPGGLTPNPIHVGGGPLTAGDVRHYQCWYRDAAVFCSADTYNLTQGLTLSWAP